MVGVFSTTCSTTPSTSCGAEITDRDRGRARRADRAVDRCRRARGVRRSTAAGGAVVSFAGVVRNHDGVAVGDQAGVLAHPSAAQVLADAVAEVAAEASGVRAIAVSHRVELLQIGDAALIAVVAADHRGAAFQTCARLVDRVKELPLGVEAPVLRRLTAPPTTGSGATNAGSDVAASILLDTEEDTHYAHCSGGNGFSADFVAETAVMSITQELAQTESSWSITGSDSWPSAGTGPGTPNSTAWSLYFRFRCERQLLPSWKAGH